VVTACFQHPSYTSSAPVLNFLKAFQPCDSSINQILGTP
jgi:hypothetical protein